METKKNCSVHQKQELVATALRINRNGTIIAEVEPCFECLSETEAAIKKAREEGEAW